MHGRWQSWLDRRLPQAWLRWLCAPLLVDTLALTNGIPGHATSITLCTGWLYARVSSSGDEEIYASLKRQLAAANECAPSFRA